MAITAKRNQQEYVLHPEGGPYPAVVSKLGLHENMQTQFGLKDRVQITFETSLRARDHIEGIEDNSPLTISMFCNNNLNDRSRLLDLVTQQIPKEQLLQLLNEENGEIDLEGLLVGTQWLIVVEHTESNGTTYANIKSAMRAPADQQLVIWGEGALAY